MELENIVEICVAIDIAILGIAYPIIIDKISNIGDKYSSEYLAELFDRELPQTLIFRKFRYPVSLFKLTLVATIFSFIFLILNCKPLFGWNNWVINNSAKIVVLILTCLTTFFFFLWLSKVSLYMGRATRLLKRLVTRYPGLPEDSEIKGYYLKSINELTLYAVSKQDEHLQMTLLEFYHSIFSDIRRKYTKDEPLIYPVDLYRLINKLNYELVGTENRKLPAIEHRAISGIWLLGEFEDIKISEETYSWIWQNLYIVCENDKFIMMFWANSSQYFDYRLEQVFPDYDFDGDSIWDGEDLVPLNKDVIKEREVERDRFLELHYALGGLVLYKRKYQALRYMVNYTQSMPPRYALMPHSMNDIFFWFEHFRNEFKVVGTPIDTKYYFPGLDNLGNRRQVVYWICLYLTILFVRQYSLTPHLIIQNFTGLPTNLPDDIIELNSWLDSVSYFDQCLYDLLTKEDVLEAVNLKKTVDEKKDEMLEFPQRLKERINQKIGDKKVNVALSEAKVGQFETASNRIISNSFQSYKDVIVESRSAPQDSDLKIPIRGGAILMTKSAFTDGDIPHLNFDTIFAEQISKNNISRLIPASFLNANTQRYLLSFDNIITGLEKLIKDENETIIVGLNLSYQLSEVLRQSAFGGIVRQLNGQSARDTIFVLKKKDLPIVVFEDLPKKEAEIYKAKLINPDIKLYSSVIDLSDPANAEFKDRWTAENFDQSDPRVELTLIILADIYWKKDRKVIQINLASQYREEGIQSNVNEIEPI